MVLASRPSTSSYRIGPLLAPRCLLVGGTPTDVAALHRLARGSGGWGSPCLLTTHTHRMAKRARVSADETTHHLHRSALPGSSPNRTPGRGRCPRGPLPTGGEVVASPMPKLLCASQSDSVMACTSESTLMGPSGPGYPLGVRIGNFEGWKPQKVGGCGWCRCPRNRILSHVAKDMACSWFVAVGSQNLGLPGAFLGRFRDISWS